MNAAPAARAALYVKIIVVSWTGLSYDLEALAEILDGTWGRSAQPTVGTSVRVKFVGEGSQLAVSAMTVARASPQQRRVAIDTATSELDSIIAMWSKHVRDAYKERTGSTLKLSLDSSSDAKTDIKPIGRTDNSGQYLIVRSVLFAVT